MKPRSSRRTAVASHRTNSTPAQSRPWRDVLVVATVLTAAMPALVVAVSAPLMALAAVALGALAIRAARALARRDPPDVRRAWAILKRVLSRPAER